MVLLSQALPSWAEEHGREANVSCPSNFQCGSTSLMFPFIDLGRYNCGLCMVDCSSKPFPKIALEYPPGEWLIAKYIGNPSMTLHSKLLASLLKNRSCLTFYYQLSLPNSPSISFTTVNTITLFRCKKTQLNFQTLNESLPGFGYYNGCLDHIFYNKDPNLGLPGNRSLGPNCLAIHLPYDKSFPQDNRSDDVEVFGLLSPEYDLQWHVSEDCNECRSRGGICETDWSKQSRCVNADGISSSTGKKKLPIILDSVGAALATTFVLSVFVIFLIRRRNKRFKGPFVFSKNISNQSKLDLEALAGQCGSLAPKCYSYSEIKKMTNSFHYELGKGGYGTVYKGMIRGGHFVAVKLLNSANGNDQDFFNEVLSISRTSHVNVVKLLGFCIKGKKRALVYEYMANGSLEKYIYSLQNDIIFHLSMKNLYQISLGVARGLEYLHSGCNTRILHFDIKPHNILLDGDFHPKISDFGMSKQYSTKKESGVSSFLEPRGTIGYIAPEVISRCFGVVSYKSDVYSFGMMILEIVGRRKNVIQGASHASEVFFPAWAYQHLIIEKDLHLKGGVANLEEEEDEVAKKMLLVGLWCIQKYPSIRPEMSKVIEMLEGDIQAIQIPPKPFFDNSPSTSPPEPFVSENSSTR